MKTSRKSSRQSRTVASIKLITNGKCVARNIPKSLSNDTCSHQNEQRIRRQKQSSDSDKSATFRHRTVVESKDMVRNTASVKQDTKTTQIGSTLTHPKNNASQTIPSSHDLGVNTDRNHETQSSQTVPPPVDSSTNTESCQGMPMILYPSALKLGVKGERETTTHALGTPYTTGDCIGGAINTTTNAGRHNNRNVAKPAQIVDRRSLDTPMNAITAAQPSHETHTRICSFADMEQDRAPPILSASVWPDQNTDSTFESQTEHTAVYSGANKAICNASQTTVSAICVDKKTEHNQGSKTVPSAVCSNRIPGNEDRSQTMLPLDYSTKKTDRHEETQEAPVDLCTTKRHGPQTIQDAKFASIHDKTGVETQLSSPSKNQLPPSRKTNSSRLGTENVTSLKTDVVQTECALEGYKPCTATRIPRQTFRSPVKTPTTRNDSNRYISTTQEMPQPPNQRRRWKESDAKLALASIESRYAPAAPDTATVPPRVVTRTPAGSTMNEANERISRIPIRTTQSRLDTTRQRMNNETESRTKSHTMVEVINPGTSNQSTSTGIAKRNVAEGSCQDDMDSAASNNTVTRSLSQLCTSDASVDIAIGKENRANEPKHLNQSESDNSLESKSRRILPTPRYSSSEHVVSHQIEHGTAESWEMGYRAVQRSKPCKPNQTFPLQGVRTQNLRDGFSGVPQTIKNRKQDVESSTGFNSVSDKQQFAQSDTDKSSKVERETCVNKSAINSIRKSCIDSSSGLQNYRENSPVRQHHNRQEFTNGENGLVSVLSNTKRSVTVRWQEDTDAHASSQRKPLYTSESETSVVVGHTSGDGVSVRKRCNSVAVESRLRFHPESPAQSQKTCCSKPHRERPRPVLRTTGIKQVNRPSSNVEHDMEETSFDGRLDRQSPEKDWAERNYKKQREIRQSLRRVNQIQIATKEDSRVRGVPDKASSCERKREVDRERHSGKENSSRQSRNYRCTGRRNSESDCRSHRHPRLRRSQSEPMKPSDPEIRSSETSGDETVIFRKSVDNKTVWQKTEDNSRYSTDRNHDSNATTRDERKSRTCAELHYCEEDTGTWRKCERWLSSADLTVSNRFSSTPESECDTDHSAEEGDLHVCEASGRGEIRNTRSKSKQVGSVSRTSTRTSHADRVRRKSIFRRSTENNVCNRKNRSQRQTQSSESRTSVLLMSGGEIFDGRISRGDNSVSEDLQDKSRRNTKTDVVCKHRRNDISTLREARENDESGRRFGRDGKRTRGRQAENTRQCRRQSRKSSSPRRQDENDSPRRRHSRNNISHRRHAENDSLSRRQDENDSPRRRHSRNNISHRRHAETDSLSRRQDENDSPCRRHSRNNSSPRRQSENDSQCRRPSRNNSSPRRQSDKNSSTARNTENKSPSRRQSRNNSSPEPKADNESKTENNSQRRRQSRNSSSGVYSRRQSRNNSSPGRKRDTLESETPETSKCEASASPNSYCKNMTTRESESYSRVLQMMGNVRRHTRIETSKELPRKQVENNTQVQEYSKVVSCSNDSASSTSSKSEFEMILKRIHRPVDTTTCPRERQAGRWSINCPSDTSISESYTSCELDQQRDVLSETTFPDSMVKHVALNWQDKSTSQSSPRRMVVRRSQSATCSDDSYPERYTHLVPHQSLHDLSHRRMNDDNAPQLNSDLDISNTTVVLRQMLTRSDSDASFSSAPEPLRVGALPWIAVGETSPCRKTERNARNAVHESSVRRTFGYTFLTKSSSPGNNSRSSDSDTSLEEIFDQTGTSRQMLARNSSSEKLCRRPNPAQLNSDRAVVTRRQSSNTSLIVLLLRRDNDMETSNSELSVLSCPAQEPEFLPNRNKSRSHRTPDCARNSALGDACAADVPHMRAIHQTVVHRQSVRVTSLPNTQPQIRSNGRVSCRCASKIGAADMDHSKPSAKQNVTHPVENTNAMQLPECAAVRSCDNPDCSKFPPTEERQRLVRSDDYPVDSANGSHRNQTTTDKATMVTDGGDASSALIESLNVNSPTTGRLHWLVAVIRCTAPYCWLHHLVTVLNEWARDREMALLTSLQTRQRRRRRSSTVSDT